MAYCTVRIEITFLVLNGVKINSVITGQNKNNQTKRKLSLLYKQHCLTYRRWGGAVVVEHTASTAVVAQHETSACSEVLGHLMKQQSNQKFYKKVNSRLHKGDKIATD